MTRHLLDSLFVALGAQTLVVEAVFALATGVQEGGNETTSDMRGDSSSPMTCPRLTTIASFNSKTPKAI